MKFKWSRMRGGFLHKLFVLAMLPLVALVMVAAGIYDRLRSRKRVT